MKKKRPYRAPTRSQRLLYAITAVGLFAIGMFLVILFISLRSEETPETEERLLSEQVKQYEDEVYEQLEKTNNEEYTPILLAVMMQESGGRGDDPMQASESYCGEVNCITDPGKSIEHGAEHFVNVLEEAEGDVKLAVQSYNFGAGFIDFVNEHGGSYTEELAIEFSQLQYENLENPEDYRCIREESEELEACYGDIQYVDAVYSYYQDALNTVQGKAEETD